MTITDPNAQVDLDLVYAGFYRSLEDILTAANTEDDYRLAAAEIGRALARDGSWRASWKLSKGWNGAKTAWDALKDFVAQNAIEEPWWYILDYAQGKDLGQGVNEFFA